jgi:polyphosphate kinase 2 (PPK2 family)
MDAAGKDGTIRHVMLGVNPQGTEIHSFKAPPTEELDHDFLWRSMKASPERGGVGIFNRSHYEEVLIVRVPSEILDLQHLPPGAKGKFERRAEASLTRAHRYGGEELEVFPCRCQRAGLLGRQHERF